MKSCSSFSATTYGAVATVLMFTPVMSLTSFRRYGSDPATASSQTSKQQIQLQTIVAAKHILLLHLRDQERIFKLQLWTQQQLHQLSLVPHNVLKASAALCHLLVDERESLVLALVDLLALGVHPVSCSCVSKRARASSRTNPSACAGCVRTSQPSPVATHGSQAPSRTTCCCRPWP